MKRGSSQHSQVMSANTNEALINPRETLLNAQCFYQQEKLKLSKPKEFVICEKGMLENRDFS